MAIDTKQLTVSARDIMAMPLRVRQEAASRGLLDIFATQMLPGQIASAFPSYVKNFTTGGTQTTPSFAGGTGARSGAGVNATGSYPSADGRYTGPPLKASDVRGIQIDRKTMMSGVYKSFVNAGFSKKQALALTAEVGRENDFNPKFVFGTHLDPYNNATNIGFMSWQKERAVAVQDFLIKEGVMDPETKAIKQGQEALDAMARFTLEEMKTNPEYKEAADKFLGNPDIDSETAASILGHDYIKWRIDDPRYSHHVTKRQQYYSDILGIVNTEEQQTATGEQPGDTATPLPNNVETIPENYQNYPEVIQDQGTEARTRKLPLDADLEKRIAFSADMLGKVTPTGNDSERKFRWRSKSGGQPSAEQARPGERVGSTAHDHGKASDGYLVEIMPDGTERTVSLTAEEDKPIIKQWASILGETGITEFGPSLKGNYEGMGENEQHISTVGDSGIYVTLPAGYDYIKESYDRGRSTRQATVERGGDADGMLTYWAQARAEENKKLEAEGKVTTQPLAAPVSSYEYNDKGQPMDPNTGYLMDKSDPRYAQALGQSPTTAPTTISDITGTSTGTNAAAGGAQIDKPYLAQPVDGAGPNILMGETGPEKIVPRHRADDFGIQSYQMQQMSQPEPAKADVIGSQNMQQPQYLPKPTFAPEPKQTVITAEHTPIPASLRKQYADSKMENRLDNLSPIGSVYSNFGFA